MNEEQKQVRLDQFSKFYTSQNDIIGYRDKDGNVRNYFWAQRTYRQDYTPEKIDQIINSGSITEKRQLSIDFFNTNGNYRSVILYYATLLYYYWVLIPQTRSQKELKKKKYKNIYDDVLNFISRSQMKNLCTRWAITVLTEGIYYGIIANISKDKMVVIDLPSDYCRTNYIDLNGNEIIEFNLNYFDKFTDSAIKEQIIKNYPKYIQKAYRRYKDNSATQNQWYMIPSNFGVCFSFFNGDPLFVTAIPAIKQYKDAVEIEQLRDLEEIKKIIVQHVPHIASTGDLVFEPDEAEIMHKGAVNMMAKNENVSVLTTYADVDAIVSRSSADTASNNLEKMLNNVYASVGASGQLFSLAGASSLKYSMNKDLALMMVLANKFMNCITNAINFQFEDSRASYNYYILPIAEYNKKEYVDNYIKLASLGYSFIMPMVAMGIK